MGGKLFLGKIPIQQRSTRSKLPIVLVLIAGSFLSLLNQTLLLTATPQIMLDLDLTENTVQWLTTVFMLVNGIMIPITAFLMETFTTRKLFMTSMCVFFIGTVICAIALNFPILMFGRIIQAIGAGILMPLMMTVLIMIFPIERRGTIMGTVGLVISFAPALAPVIAGWLIEFIHWRFLFLIVLPLVIIDIIFAYFVLKNVITRTFPKVDFISIALSTIGFGGLLFGFSTIGGNEQFNYVTFGVIILGFISLGFFIRRQFILKQPVLEFRVFQNKTFRITTVIGMVGFMGLISSETILPIYMQNMASFTALDAGMMMLPGALLMGFLSPIVGRIFDHIGARWLLIIGLGITTVTTLLFTNLSADTTLTYLTLVFTIRMLGLSMILMPATTAGINQLPRHLIPHGTAMNNTMRQVGASIGTALLVSMMTSRFIIGDVAESNTEAFIHGVNVSFYAATAITFIAFILAFFVRDREKNRVKQVMAKAVGGK